MAFIQAEEFTRASTVNPPFSPLEAHFWSCSSSFPPQIWHCRQFLWFRTTAKTPHSLPRRPSVSFTSCPLVSLSFLSFPYLSSPVSGCSGQLGGAQPLHPCPYDLHCRFQSYSYDSPSHKNLITALNLKGLTWGTTIDPFGISRV